MSFLILITKQDLNTPSCLNHNQSVPHPWNHLHQKKSMAWYVLQLVKIIVFHLVKKWNVLLVLNVPLVQIKLPLIPVVQMDTVHLDCVNCVQLVYVPTKVYLNKSVTIKVAWYVVQIPKIQQLVATFAVNVVVLKKVKRNHLVRLVWKLKLFLTVIGPKEVPV